MYLRDSFKPTPSRFAFEPASMRGVISSPRHIEREVVGYWWGGTPKQRVLHNGLFHFTWTATDDRLAPYQHMDYARMLVIAGNAARWDNNRQVWNYSTALVPGASYEVGALSIHQPGWNTGPLVEFLDSLTGRSKKRALQPLVHPRGTDGWYSTTRHGGDTVKVDQLRLYRYEQFQAELDAAAAAELIVHA